MLIRASIALLVLTLSAGSGGATLKNQPSNLGWLDQQPPSPAPPRVRPEFQPEVTRLAAEGLRIREAVEASSGGSRYMAAIFEREKPKEYSEAFEFRIIESDGRTSHTVFRRTEFFFTFTVSDSMASLNGTDINRDGFPEIIVQGSSGGNGWSCNPTEIYRIKNHKAELIAAGPIHKIADLDGDGVVELLVTDARWESYADLSHASSPSATMVYRWRNGQYVYASRDFASYYASELEQLRGLINEAKSEITPDEFSDEGYVGLAASLAITYAHAGDPERGIEEMERLLSSNIKSDKQSKRRKTIISDFRSGESSKKLREMKYGDAMPLG